MLKTGKRILAVILSLTLLSVLLTGCNLSDLENLDTDALSRELQAHSGEIDELMELLLGQTEEAPAAEETSALPMDPSVMKPWINSNIHGMITDEINFSEKDDFYVNTNHDWLRDIELRPGHPQEAPVFGGLDIVQDRCLDMLTDDTLTGEDAERIQAFYKLWLDWDSRNAEGITPLLPYLEKLKAVSTLDEMSDLILSEDSMLWGTSLAGIGLDFNKDDSSLYEVEIFPAGLFLKDPAEYSKLTENGKRHKTAFEKKCSYMFSRLGFSDDEAKELIAQCLEFETLLAAHMKTTLEQNDPDRFQERFNPVTMEEIRKLSPNYPLAQYMEYRGWSASKLINLMEPAWLSGLNELYTEENLPLIKARMFCRLADFSITCVDEEAFRTYQKINQESVGMTSSRPDEELAYEDTRTLFQNCFARLYVERYLNDEIRQEITKLCQDTIDTYYDMLDEDIDWLSEETRKEAQNKLRHITIHAVYPDKWPDDSMYRITPKEKGGSYLLAQKEYIKASLQDNLSKLNTSVDKDIWMIDILETNAFYNPPDNSINIIPGFFCDTTYRSDMSTEEKYGALGCVIGHEISHAFDPVGSQYDAYGNVKNWWTDEDREAFSKRSQKLIDFYDQVVPFDNGTAYHGQLVQTEAIADLAGFKCLLKMAEKIDGFDYDKFFRAYAHLWAMTITLEGCEYLAATDVHPLNYLRCNTTVAQFDEFIKTYGIKEGDGMYFAPEDRIAVW
ncbi:MAG: M13 family metallopeptidase [Lachnospiraceae bacterium]|nr:M13 family metallopeptidase [Lachnospiraceae bacterium]